MKRSLDYEISESSSTSKEDYNVPKDRSRRKYQIPNLLGTIKVLDGSFKYEMEKIFPGCEDHTLYNYNLTSETSVRAVHDEFLKAGANIIRTNTTGAFFSVILEKFPTYTETKYKEMITAAVQIAKSAVDEHNGKTTIPWKKALVVGTCGHFKRSQETPLYKVKNEYKRLINALSDAGITRFCLQDIRSLKDALIFLKLLRELQKEKTTALMMFKPNPAGKLIDKKDWLETAVKCYKQFPLLAVGLNGLNPGEVRTLIKRQESRDKVEEGVNFAICSNNNNKRIGFQWQPIGIQTINAAKVNKWVDFGIHFIGGCKGVSAKDIKYISDQLEIHSGTGQVAL